MIKPVGLTRQSIDPILVSKTLFLLLSFIFMASVLTGQSFKASSMEKILYGVAYYPEYMPSERLEEDVKLMKECGINMVRIAESTWAFQEPRDGEFNLDYIGKVLDIMHRNDIEVIVGTPTYAIPSWLAKKHPEILVETKQGKSLYGPRQNMDISHPTYRYYAERIIRKLVDYVHDHPAVIGYQVDNETKHYQTGGENVQKQFVKYLQTQFTSPGEMTKAYGLNYWSNSIFHWEDMPSTLGSINASLINEFKTFQRQLVTDFLAWQVDIVNEYKRPGQFVMQNFDLEWRDGSYAIQPDVDHFEASRALDIAGIDIYHKTQDDLDGVTIGLAGDLARSMKQDNYLVVETQAQSILNTAKQRLHYPGQLRLQAYSHLASGANMVAYWPWHSIHNAAETYWKGLLSHDMEPNPTFLEAKQIATEFQKLGKHLVNLEKSNKVAIYFSNESLSALDWFYFSKSLNYNDIVRNFYEILFKANIECDFIDHTSQDLSKYKLILVPPLYVASEKELERLNRFAKDGGHILYAFKSGFSNENVQVHTLRQPGALREPAGISYQQFTNIDKLPLKENPFEVAVEENYVSIWAELLNAESAEVIASYDHPHWGKYAAITKNRYGKGSVTYLGTWPSQAILEKVIQKAAIEAKVADGTQKLAFPLITRSGQNKMKKMVHYFLNYSPVAQSFSYPFDPGIELFSGKDINTAGEIQLEPWDLVIVEEK